MKSIHFLKLGLFILAAAHLSCRKDFSTTNNSGNLSFSKDTIFLDTVFNNLTTTTHLLTVYNKGNNDINIPKIKLSKDNSKYRINVDGISGTEFDNVLLLKKDSLFIFVEVTADILDTDEEMLYKDLILFDSDTNQQKVSLITLVKDAHFLFPNEGTDYEINQTQFTNTKPYVIYGNAIVPENSELIIDAGTMVYFNENASLSIAQGATLNINGTKKDSIIFRSDNLNYEYNQIPGQWKGINLNNTGIVNINYLKILNPITGFKITNNTNLISLKNTEIYNAAEDAIYTENANIDAENIIIGQAGKSNLYLQGGNYIFRHCTFANYWNKGFKSESNVSLANYYLDENNSLISSPLNNANFVNCIISGNRTSELFLDKKKQDVNFNFHLKNCLLNLEKRDGLYDTTDSILYTNVLLNKKLDFRNTSINDLRIGIENEGINRADLENSKLVPFDILEQNRIETPDIGAYQHIDFKTLEPQENEE